MRRSKSKLNLSRMTIRSLSAEDLRRPAGGLTTDCYIDSQKTIYTCVQTIYSCDNLCGGYQLDTGVLSVKTNCKAGTCYPSYCGC